jgi:hypothetical protein
MVVFKGKKPDDFYKSERKKLVAVINEEATQLETNLVAATPGDTGALRQGWTLKPASEKGLAAIVGQNKVHFLPLELGRKPGTGISQKGQEAVSVWAKRKLGLTGQEAKSFAFLLSRKYKKFGRPAEGFAGLAKPGQPAQPIPNEPVGGPILESFKRLNRRLR